LWKITRYSKIAFATSRRVHHLRDGFLESARTSLLKILDIDPNCKLVYQGLFRVEQKTGEPGAVDRATQRIHIASGQLNLEYSEHPRIFSNNSDKAIEESY
jgi:hypothetical protein